MLDESCTNLQTQIRIKDEEYVIKPIMREMTYITTLPPILPIPDKELISLKEPYRSQAESQTPSSKPLKFSEGIENTILKPMTSPIESDSYSMQQSIEASSSSLTAARKRKRLIRRNRTTNVRFNKRKVVKTVRGPNQLKVFLEPHDKDVIFIDSYKKHRNFYEFRNVTDQMKWFRKYSKLMQSMTSFGPAMFNPMLNPYNLMAMGMGMGMGQPMMEPQFAPFMSQFRNTDVHPTNNNKKKDNRKKSRSRIKSSPIIDDDDNDNDDDDVSEKVVVPSREPQSKLIFYGLKVFFQFFVGGPHQRIFEIFEKVEFLHDHEELAIGNGTVIFSERSSFRKANSFFNLTQFKIIDFLTSADLT